MNEENKMICSFTVLGDPHSQKRHRHAKRGNFVHTYDPSKDEKMDFMVVAQNEAPAAPIGEAIYVEIDCYFSRPKSHFGTGKNSDKLKASSPEHHIKKPDSDNLAKFVFDALNGVFWVDDSYIVGFKVMKYYDAVPRTEVRVYSFMETCKPWTDIDE